LSDSNVQSRDLKLLIKNRIIGKAAIAGIGNIMRGDDGLGPKLIELLRARSVNAPLFDCGTAPENYIFPMLKSACDTIILIDAANMGLDPGDARIIDVDDITNVSFSTHSPSPKLFIDLLKMGNENMNIFVISVQPKDTSLGSPLSEEVLRGLDVLADAFCEALT
jgi:hydrogenase 3 maturation protease